MDKLSVVRDAIDYIQQLQEEERRILQEISEMECSKKEEIRKPEVHTEGRDATTSSLMISGKNEQVTRQIEPSSSTTPINLREVLS